MVLQKLFRNDSKNQNLKLKNVLYDLVVFIVFDDVLDYNQRAIDTFFYRD